MDSSLQLQNMRGGFNPIGSFNPYFNGFFSSIRFIERETRRFYQVSILVLMDSSLQYQSQGVIDI